MKNIICLFTILGILLLSSCTKVDEEDRKNVGTLTLPVAAFYFDGNDGPAPVTVNFHNSSEYSDQWEWKFTQYGPTSNEFEPSFTYQNNSGQEKTFQVTLTATDTYTGETNIRSQYVSVQPSN